MTTRISAETAAKLESVWQTILAGIAGGDLVRDVLQAAGVTYEHVRALKAQYPQRRIEWEEAQEASANAFMDEALDVARGAGEVALDEKGQVIYGKDGKPLIIRQDPALARVRVDLLKWAARIRNPKAYSDRAQLDVTVKTVDLTRIIAEADERLRIGRAPRVLEHDQGAAALGAGHAAGAAIEDQARKLLQLL